MIESPPTGPGRSGIIPFSGRALPLPAGTWQQLVLARGSGRMAVQVELLGRVEAQRATGLLLVIAPSPLGNAAGEAARLAPCDVQNAIAHQTVSADQARDPLSHECWSLIPIDMEASGSPAKTDPALLRGLGRLRDMGVAVPGHMVALSYQRSDPTGWLSVLLLVPDRSADQPAASRKLLNWVRRFAPLLHKGFDDTLSASELAPGLARDPE